MSIQRHHKAVQRPVRLSWPGKYSRSCNLCFVSRDAGLRMGLVKSPSELATWVTCTFCSVSQLVDSYVLRGHNVLWPAWPPRTIKCNIYNEYTHKPMNQHGCEDSLGHPLRQVNVAVITTVFEPCDNVCDEFVTSISDAQGRGKRSDEKAQNCE
jgi:hypothetical protein